MYNVVEAVLPAIGALVIVSILCWLQKDQPFRDWAMAKLYMGYLLLYLAIGYLGYAGLFAVGLGVHWLGHHAESRDLVALVAEVGFFPGKKRRSGQRIRRIGRPSKA
jgi:hypothetical protein